MFTPLTNLITVPCHSSSSIILLVRKQTNYLIYQPKRSLLDEMSNFMKIFFLMSLSSPTLLSLHWPINFGPIPLVAHHISSSLDSTSHASSPLLSNHKSIQSPTTKNDDFSSPSRPFELVIEPSSQIDSNPPPSPSATLLSLSPVPSFSSIPSAPPAKTPIFSPETHSPEPAAPLCHSSCHITPPIKLHDYVCSHVSSDQSSSLIPGPTKGTRYPLPNYVSYHRYKPAYRSFVAQHSAVT